MSALLQARGLSLSINGTSILKSISFQLSAGETLGLVGESGSGKSMTALSLIGLLPPGAALSGSLMFDGDDLLAKPEADFCRLRGRKISMAFQEPMTALNPVQNIGDQVAEVFFPFFQPLEMAQVEKVVDNIEHADPGLADVADIFPVLRFVDRAQRLALHHVGEPDDGVQGRAQVVAEGFHQHAVGVAEAFQLLQRLFQALVGYDVRFIVVHLASISAMLFGHVSMAQTQNTARGYSIPLPVLGGFFGNRV